MKTIFNILTGLFISISVMAQAQEYVSSDVKLSKEAIGKTTADIVENAVIRVNEQNDEFAFSIRLFPILASSNDNDSIATLNKNMVLDYKASFPIDDLAFFEPGNNGKKFILRGNLTINNISKPVQLDFYLQEYMPQGLATKDIQTYPVRMSFALEINPAEYGLDNETAKFTEKIIIVVGNGIINRTKSESF